MEAVRSDFDLLEAARSGDNRAFDLLVKRHQRAVYGLARRELGNHGDADEVAQLTFVKAYRALEGFRGTGSFKSWLLRICVNACRNYRRARKRLVEATPESMVELTHQPQPGHDLDADRHRRLLREAVKRLPDKQRLAVELRIYQDLPFSEVAQVMGGTVNAAKVNFHHAVKALKGLLKDQEEAA